MVTHHSFIRGDLGMLLLVTYDVSTETTAGRKRLSKVAKVCKNYGQRVQASVFECNVDYGQSLQLKQQLSEIIDPETDSLRFYNLGNNWNSRIEHIGAKPSYNSEGVLFV